MTEPRFTVRRVKNNIAPKLPKFVGWAVFDREQCITIPFGNYAEAVQHCENIHRLYLRYGW